MFGLLSLIADVRAGTRLHRQREEAERARRAAAEQLRVVQATRRLDSGLLAFAFLFFSLMLAWYLRAPWLASPLFELSLVGPVILSAILGPLVARWVHAPQVNELQARANGRPAVAR